MLPREKLRTVTDEKMPEALLPAFFCSLWHKFEERKGGDFGMQKEEQNKRWHNLVLEDRKVLKASGVSDVEGFDETKIYAMLEGLSFTIGGKNLKVISFSAESGNLVVEGEIDSVTYSNALSRKAGLFERIFR